MAVARSPPCVLILLFATAALADLASSPQPLDLLHGGYPRAFFFRQSEEAAAAKHAEFSAWSREFGSLMGIMGKTLDEELPGRSQNIDFFTRFKTAHPTQAVLLHINGNSRDPRFENARFFAGHWLYFNGAKITADVPATAGEAVIHVSDPDLFEAKGGKHGGSSNDDVGICLLDANGRPDWSHSEQVELIAVDKQARTLRVRRGTLATPIRAFPAGQTYAASHCSQDPSGSPESRVRWLYNYATSCPADAQGHSCSDVFAAHLAELFRPGGKLAA